MDKKTDIKQSSKAFAVTREFGKRLKQARLKLGINVQEASEMLDIEKNSYYKYEDGTRFPKPDTLLDIMNKFHLSIDYLLTGEFQAPLDNTGTKKGDIKDIIKLFPGIPEETCPLIEVLQVPIMKHTLMMHYLAEREKYKNFIEDYFSKTGKIASQQ
ncbi:MAG: helix-turn-helix domain-containing protein [Candidatus Aminicenantes bacterium]|nr:helix-turn-helix domain-containing protein [Candidatus Aminicenantes bacterium]NIM78464.1 helix-turn-helix domain-containing protein [Candidatus Aminicenantes bacterium]NIN17727.1 helix-turn-helix domain-containing protein [Candidatus Aminicenantes bacterium]NIN41603.1 helix-turn-helix domain-containing protein [Candidatus Aminicenantes bacterium]NIN84377.1 helix-turn-helix domain-containing protein [Candidatus Aminicenantes bacterium]